MEPLIGELKVYDKQSARPLPEGVALPPNLYYGVNLAAGEQVTVETVQVVVAIWPDGHREALLLKAGQEPGEYLEGATLSLFTLGVRLP